MPVERMRMRPWLEEQINQGLIQGLKWVNRVSRGLSCVGGVTGWLTVTHFTGLLLRHVGEKDLPDSLDACSTTRLGCGEGRSLIQELGHPHR